MSDTPASGNGHGDPLRSELTIKFKRLREKLRKAIADAHPLHHVPTDLQLAAGTLANALQPDVKKSEQHGTFSQHALNNVDATFMCHQGTRLIRLLESGGIQHPAGLEYFWRVFNGQLEFLGPDQKTVSTRWTRYFTADGRDYACARSLSDHASIHVLAFENNSA